MTINTRFSRSAAACTRIGCASVLMAAGSATAGSLDADRAYAAELRNQAFEDAAWSPDQVRSDNSSIQVSALMQARYMYSNRRAGSGLTRANRITGGFVLPRTQITFDGSIVSSRLTYKLTMDFGDAELGRGRGTAPPVAGGSGTPQLLDAYAQYNFDGKREGYYLKVGQFKHIMHTEEAIAPEYQLAVERSLTNEFFNHGYTQGVAVGRVDRDVAWEVSITDGGRYLSSGEVANTPITAGNEADIAVSGRIDWKLSGSWEQFADFTSFQGSQTGLKIGGGLLWMLQGDTNPGGFTPPILFPPLRRAEIFSWTVDVQYEGDGWNLYAAYMGNTIDWQFATDVELYLANHGFVVQGGYFMTERSEVYVRGEAIFFDDSIANFVFGVNQGQPVPIVAFGWNYYVIPESHAAKFTVDVSAVLEDTFGFTVGTTSSDTLPDPSTTGFIGGTSSEYLVRAQFQILF